MYSIEAHSRLPVMKLGVCETLPEAIESIENGGGFKVIHLASIRRINDKTVLGYWVTLDNPKPTRAFPSRMAWFLREVPF